MCLRYPILDQTPTGSTYGFGIGPCQTRCSVLAAVYAWYVIFCWEKESEERREKGWRDRKAFIHKSTHNRAGSSMFDERLPTNNLERISRLESATNTKEHRSQEEAGAELF